MRERSVPPAIAYGILCRILPANQLGRTILGDLHEEMMRVRPNWRRVWYWWAGAGIALGYVIGGRGGGARRRPRRPGGFVGSLALDLRYAIRSLGKQPGFTATVVATLGLGIGASTAIFSAVNGTLFRPLPYPDADRLVRIADQGENAESPFHTSDMSWLNFRDLTEGASSFERMVAYQLRTATVSGWSSGARRVMTLRVGADFFPLLQTPPAFGRDFVETDQAPGALPVAVLSDALWRSDFNANPSVLGESIRLDGVPHTIIAVARPEFEFVRDADVFVPLRLEPSLTEVRRRRQISGLGRLRPGVSVEAGRDELRTLFRGLIDRYPEATAGWTVTVLSFKDWLVGQRTPRLLRLFSFAVGAVLVIACVNVTNLMLSRSLTRRREWAVRSALGAGRARLAQLVVVESVLLATAGGTVGILFSIWGTSFLLTAYGNTLARASGVATNLPVVWFGVALASLVGLAVGLATSLTSASPQRLAGQLRGGARGGTQRSVLGGSLVAVEIALATVLVVGAGMLTASLRRLSDIDLGIETRDIWTFGLSLPATDYPDRLSIRRLFSTVEDRIGTVGGVESVGVTSRVPLQGGNNGLFTVAGIDPPVPQPLVELRNATAGFFHTMGLHLVAGRVFHEGDRDRADPVVIVNEAFVRAFIPTGEPLGRRLEDTEVGSAIIGVVRDFRDMGPERSAPPTAYWPLGVGPVPERRAMNLVFRANTNRADLLQTIAGRLRMIDPSLPMLNVQTMEQIATRSRGLDRRAAMSMFTILAGLALILGGVGIYGVLAFSVAQRAREVSIRLALGATKPGVLRLVMSQGMRTALIGLALGLGGSVALSRGLSRLLYDVAPSDPVVLGTVIAIMTATAIAACYLPSRRAARLEPMEILRAD